MSHIKHSNEPLTENFRDRIATVDESGKRKWIYAYKPKGFFYNARTILSFFYFIVFFGLPFVKIDGRPLFLFNIPNAKFILFGKIFWPQDFFIFGITMITFVFFIILFTAAFGRLFCGWACPQTNFMEMMFRKVEYLVLGDAPAQRQLQEAPWHVGKIIKVALKHILFYGLSFIIANFFLAYIIGVDDLYKIITEPVSQHVVGFSALLIFSAVFYAVYAFFREQACTVVCPYGRLQSVLLDRNSMIVAYDYKRGEPRGHAKHQENLGDCIDCHQCVKVCPTGIDIRNGVQMECVACTACIDACDHIMDKLDKPRGLIRYASENTIANGEPLRYTNR
ncbi:MAG: cytochrome c oxidase accessory protein CcoG, partial [Pedobacter sp.]|nr:cytochrome c oxidase accessory protein CcoG [Pedobacter sp.]